MPVFFTPCRYDREHIYEEARSGRVTANVWGYMTVHGLGDIFEINGRFTANKYVNLLEECFLPSLRERNFPFPPGPVVFIHDRCPIHTARLVQQWLANQQNLHVLDWPSKGCDMNPIENLWGSLVNTWEPERERTVAQLMEHTRTQWELLRGDQDLARNLVASMPNRLQEVIVKEGGWTRF